MQLPSSGSSSQRTSSGVPAGPFLAAIQQLSNSSSRRTSSGTHGGSAYTGAADKGGAQAAGGMKERDGWSGSRLPLLSLPPEWLEGLQRAAQQGRSSVELH
eukprot:scaffold139822_cov18-Tisochrysis_lutea.AAC.1